MLYTTVHNQRRGKSKENIKIWFSVRYMWNSPLPNTFLGVLSLPQKLRGRCLQPLSKDCSFFLLRAASHYFSEGLAQSIEIVVGTNPAYKHKQNNNNGGKGIKTESREEMALFFDEQNHTHTHNNNKGMSKKGKGEKNGVRWKKFQKLKIERNATQRRWKDQKMRITKKKKK